MRIVLVILIFQFIAPAFFSIVAQNAEPSKETSGYHAEHSSIVVPILLKEKEETEESHTDNTYCHFIALIDFTDHSFVLTELHKIRFTPFTSRDRYDFQPPLFALHGAYII